MGANGAGKSTLVKILTGAVRPDGGTHRRARPRADRPLAGRGAPRRPRLRLPGAGAHPGPRHPVQPAPDRHAGRAVPPLARTSSASRHLDLSSMARRVPLASLRIIDLARALAIEPDVLMLDEMTAALPANLTERVLEVVGRQRGGDRSVIFISHRMIEIAAVCDRATVLREGETVGVVDVTEGSEERIVELMLGQTVEELPAVAERTAGGRRDARRRPSRGSRLAASAPGRSSRTSRSSSTRARCSASWRSRARGRTSCSTSSPAPSRPSGGELLVDGAPVSFRHPADAIRAGLVYVAADRAEALLMQRSVRENIALPFIDAPPPLGPDRHSARRARRSTGRSRRSRSTRAPRARSGGCRAATSRR